jgi:ABC-2 type transport system permease protein
MMSVFEAAWVIARRDFVAQVFSRAFILFLLAPLIIVGFFLLFGNMAERSERSQSRPVVALVADSATVEALTQARARLAAGMSEQSFPTFRTVAPAQNIPIQARALLADQAAGYSAVFSGTIERPLLTGPESIDGVAGRRMQMVVQDARRQAALDAAHATVEGAPIARDITEQAAGNLQMIRRNVARSGQGLIFTVTLFLATLLLTTMVEEKSNKVIEVLAAAVPLDAVFLGKLLAMLGISLVGLALWGGMAALGYTFFQLAQAWVALPTIAPAVGWPLWILLLLLYFSMNFMLLGSLFLGIGAQASSIREIQTISMPITLLQLMILLLAMNVIGGNLSGAALAAYIVPFSSPLSMIAFGAESDLLWPHLVALVWQAIWVVIIIRVSARLFRLTALKSGSSGSFFSFLKRKRAA